MEDNIGDGNSMNKEMYISVITQDIKNTLSDYRYNNYKKQVIARKLSADFYPTYDESYLWNRALFLSSNACLLIGEDQETKLASRALKESAEIYENLGAISETYDREYSLLLAAMCYDLSGYQANGYCLAKALTQYDFQSEDERVNIESDNYILSQVKEILLKNIFKARAELDQNNNIDIGIGLFNNAVSKWYENALNGIENEFLNEIDDTYRYYLNAANIPISHLLILLKTRLKVYVKRSIWQNLLLHESVRESHTWHKYIRLLTHDIYDRHEIKQIDKRVSKFEFWTSQLRAIQKGLLEGETNFVIQMPTSAGKTFIAELSILNALVKHPGKRCIYIAPFRALTNEKESELGDYISKLGYSVSALSGSYEVDEFQDIILEETDVLIATPEKIDLLLRLNPDYFEQISLMVVDEGHIVGDISARSSLLEFLIIRLRMKVESVQTLFISAVMPPANADEYSVWLSGVKDNVIRSLLHEDSSPTEEWEPTRKLIGAFTWEGRNGRITFKDVETEDETTQIIRGAFVPSIIRKRQFSDTYPNGTTKAQTSAALAYRLSQEGSCLVYCAQVRDTERVAKALLAIIEAVEVENETDRLIANKERESFFFSEKWFGSDSHITQAIERGIGIHYGDMPEAVRRSVESDYSLGKLDVLISTNTIGQGLNFPIRHLIIHSTILGFSNNRPVYLSVRDFWNIIGRAGRAGKETEGQIVFVINSLTDRRSYDRYTDKANINGAYSMFFNVLDALVQDRITTDIYEDYIKVLAEPYLLNLLIEETTEEEDQFTIEQIIENSLFKVQAEEAEIDLAPIRNSFRATIRNVKEAIPIDLIKLYGETGFTLQSNQSIYEFVGENREQFHQIVNSDDYLALLELSLQLFDSGNIEEILSEKLDRIGRNPSEYLTVVTAWIQGAEIDQLRSLWSEVSDNISHLHILISDGFYYRYTWAITSVITIMAHQLGVDRGDLSDKIKSLPSYVKYGLDNPTACFARSLGIKNRNVALLLASEAKNTSGRNFIKWIANLTAEEVNGFDISPYDRQNVLNVAIKLTANRYKETPEEFEFQIRGIPFEDVRISTSKTIAIGDVLTCQRDTSNEFDPYAIKIFKEENELGFVPREFAKVISVEIDVNGTEYFIQVLDVEIVDSYNRILVSMSTIK